MHKLIFLTLLIFSGLLDSAIFNQALAINQNSKRPIASNSLTQAETKNLPPNISSEFPKKIKTDQNSSTEEDDLTIGPSGKKMEANKNTSSTVVDGSKVNINKQFHKIRRLYAILTIEHNKKVLGDIKIRLFHRRAPLTVENFIDLAEGHKEFVDLNQKTMVTRPFYDGLHFFKVVPGFMIASGDPLNSGNGGPGFTIEDESHPDLLHSKPGIVSMLNRGKPNTAGSQFFITLKKAEHLNRKYSVFGEVVEGMSVVTAISKVRRNLEDKPIIPVIIKKIRIEREFH